MGESSSAMSEESLSEWHLRRGQYLGEISALCFLHLPPQLSSLPLLLAGTGSQTLLYDLVTSKIIKSFQVLEGIRVHGISVDNISKQLSEQNLAYKVVVFGEKRVKIFNFCIEATIQSHDQSLLVDRIRLTLIHALPRFSHWVLDVCFLKDSTHNEANNILAIGCTDNSICLWDICTCNVVFQVMSPDRCLLYSMRMWGDKVENLRVASGTIFNEIIIWKVSNWNHALGFGNAVAAKPVYGPQYEAVQLCRLTGHEGSIFRIVWSSDGSKLASVSDDRSARVWTFYTETEGSTCAVNHEVNIMFFGHTARVWDCCILDSLIITAGEDCTCRVWGLDGTELKIIKEHIGRGVWRCLYDHESSLLISAGFDSAIKVHLLPTTLSAARERCTSSINKLCDKAEVFNLCIPNSSVHVGLMDSKSEYVRCLHFSREDSLYVATNNGYLYHARLIGSRDVMWSHLVRVCDEAPIVCMDILSNCSDLSSGIEDWIAVGDGKGNLTIVQVVGNVGSPEIKLCLSWSAELERQLLGTYWSKSLGYGFIFTADPRGSLKLWRLCDTSESTSLKSTSHSARLVAEYASCFGMRIMCLDASFNEEVLVCGDIRGNLLVFPLSRDLQLITSGTSDAIITQPKNYFKGAHGISSVCNVSIARPGWPGQLEIHSTGADGCICYLEYDKKRSSLEFTGMKQVKELSTIHSIFSTNDYSDELIHGSYAIGFASSEFIIWNLSAETKVVQIGCGGWRRPHSFYLGDVPENKYCFAFVKDEVIYIHRQWVQELERNVYPQNLHLQFHGREIHSLCFIPEVSNYRVNRKQACSESCWVATGCEDGTVRLTRYESGTESWSDSKLLGEHVGGSAVRSIFFVSKMHRAMLDASNMPHTTYRNDGTGEGGDHPYLLISVGAKRVVTCWKHKSRTKSQAEDVYSEQNSRNETAYHGSSISMSFQWLSTDMPTKNSNNIKRKSINHVVKTADDVGSSRRDSSSNGSLPVDENKLEHQSHLADNLENDWRYLAVTAFLVTVAESRISVCFIVVACSDATLSLRALILPYRLWFDVARLAPLSSPVLALQHMVIPRHPFSKDSIPDGSLYIVISGATDGSIAFWDLTELVRNFMLHASSLPMEKYIDFQKRPRTGRGSQGGRWWRSSGSQVLNKKSTDDCTSHHDPTEYLENNPTTKKIAEKSDQEEKLDNIPPDICEIGPLHVLNNVHQSGVNCLHVSNIEKTRVSGPAFSYFVISGGDDQAVNCSRIDLSLKLKASQANYWTANNIDDPSQHCQVRDYWIRFISPEKHISAHSSAVKGVWTNGSWVFSTGLDQRLRCWNLDENGKLIEHSNVVISVPEPESLDARSCGRDHYQIAIAGRGMQMVDLYLSDSNKSENRQHM